MPLNFIFSLLSMSIKVPFCFIKTALEAILLEGFKLDLNSTRIQSTTESGKLTTCSFKE